MAQATKKAGKSPPVASVSIKKGGVEDTEQVQVGEALVSNKPLANVGFSASYTKNLGEFESVKISVSLHMPVEIDFTSLQSLSDQVDSAYEFVQGWVDAKMNEAITDMENA